MSARWERSLERWLKAGLIEPAAAARIRPYEAQSAGLPTWRWPVRLAVGMGGLLMAAGVLLYAAAHWDRLSATARFLSVLLLVAVFHVAGALATERFTALATAMHAVGTVCLEAGIFLAGQIFHLQEHWSPGYCYGPWAPGWHGGFWVTGRKQPWWHCSPPYGSVVSGSRPRGPAGVLTKFWLSVYCCWPSPISRRCCREKKPWNARILSGSAAWPCCQLP